jgi:hypothetical protein
MGRLLGREGCQVEYMQDEVQSTCLKFESIGSCTRKFTIHFYVQGHCEEEA